ncbi:MAG: YCF48-related protein [Terrimicrobiaceae bacterium]
MWKLTDISLAILLTVPPIYCRGEVSAKEGQWQGSLSRNLVDLPPASSGSWLIGDSGGTGGSFGQGEIHKNLWDVCFRDDKIGYATGNPPAVYRTEDGGLTWTTLAYGDKKPFAGWERANLMKGVSWTSLSLSGQNEIWVGGYEYPGGQGKGVLLHSADAGRTWREELTGKLSICLRIKTTPVGDVWALAGSQQSYRSSDAGKTWEKVNWGVSAWIDDLVLPGDVPSGRTGYAVGRKGEKGCVLKTEDGGIHWTSMPLPEHTPALKRCFFISSLEGWVGGDGGILLYTGDGGITWERRDVPAGGIVKPWCPNGQPLTDILFFQDGNGWASFAQPFDGIGKLLFSHALFHTRDGGKTWYPEISGRKSISALWSNGPGHLWAVGGVADVIYNDIVAIRIWK